MCEFREHVEGSVSVVFVDFLFFFESDSVDTWDDSCWEVKSVDEGSVEASNTELSNKVMLEWGLATSWDKEAV